MNIPESIRQQVRDVVAACLAKAERHFKRSFVIPVVTYEVKGGCGGYALGDWKVDLNPILLMENLEEYLTQVVPHEVAHCIDTAIGGNARPTQTSRWTKPKRSIHGPSWKAIMRNVFGLNPDRCHRMDTTNAKVRVKAKFEYRCMKCDKRYFVSSVRHNKQIAYARVNGGMSAYNCPPCGRHQGSLVFVADHGQVSFEQAKRAANAPTKETSVADMLPPKAKLPEGTALVGNIEVAKAIFWAMPVTPSRQEFIRRCVAAGMKATTASTYFAKLMRS